MDTITCILPASEVPHTDLMGEVPVHLSNMMEQANEYGRLVKGKCGKHIYVSVREEDVRVRVSLPKLLREHSLWNVGAMDVKDGIVMISDMLHLPMERATIRKFDYAWNLEMDYSPDVYMRYLGRHGRYKRLENPGSLVYNLPSRNLNFYDKVREVKGANDPIPPEYEGRNILRYEKGYVQQVAKYFNKDTITAGMLYAPGFYRTIRENWYSDYQSIKKLRNTMIDFKVVKTVKQFATMCELAYIDRQGGVLKVLQDIDEMRKTGALSKKQVFDLKKTITDASNEKLLTCESALIAELDRKMAGAMVTYD